MSLYFNWSCDFQRFTKSKKLSKFQVRTTTLFISNKSLSTSLFNLQGTICCFQRVFTTFRRSQPLINSLFSISKPEAFVKNFFKFFFEESSRSKSNFSVLRLSLRDSFNRISNPGAFVKYFFRFLQRILLQTKNGGSRRRFLFLSMFGQNQTAERQNRAKPHDRRHGFVQNQR